MLEMTEALLDDPDQTMLEFVGFHKFFIRVEKRERERAPEVL